MLETLVRRLERGELYGCLLEGAMIGTLTLQDTDPDLWGEDGGRCLYLHTLVVRPDLRGTGLGRWMLGWAEQIASQGADPGCDSIIWRRARRCDATTGKRDSRK